MKRKELIEGLKKKYWKVNEEGIHKGKIEEGITVWGIGVFEKMGDVMKKSNLTFYTTGDAEDDDAWWGNAEPKPIAVTPIETFEAKVNEFIAAKINEDVLRFGYVERVNAIAKVALCTVIIDDTVITTHFLGLRTTEEQTIEEKTAIIREDNEGELYMEVF